MIQALSFKTASRPDRVLTKWTSGAPGSRSPSVDGVGETIFSELLAEFGSASSALAAANDVRIDHWVKRRRSLDGRPPINGPTLAALRSVAANPRTPLDEIAERGLWTLTPLDADYPRRLRDLDPPPAMINGLGDPATLRLAHAVALVGTRTPTVAGRTLAARIATRLAECGAVVVSGLAIGIDGAAHAAALAARHHRRRHWRRP